MRVRGQHLTESGAGRRPWAALLVGADSVWALPADGRVTQGLAAVGPGEGVQTSDTITCSRLTSES